jgi:hypothetical protein
VNYLDESYRRNFPEKAIISPRCCLTDVISNEFNVFIYMYQKRSISSVEHMVGLSYSSVSKYSRSILSKTRSELFYRNTDKILVSSVFADYLYRRYENIGIKLDLLYSSKT